MEANRSKSNIGLFAVVFKVLPKLIKFVKFGKLAFAGSFVAAYSFLFSWQFAVLLFLTIYIHEWGHLITMRRVGIKTKGIYMIPFVGGVALAGERFPSQRAESYIAMGGPVMGLFMAMSAMLLYVLTGQELFAHSAMWIGVINLFNLIPIYPLDGGRVVKSVSASIHSGFGGFMLFLMGIAGVVLAYYFKIGLLGFLACATLLECVIDGIKRSQFKRYDAWRAVALATVEELRQLDSSGDGAVSRARLKAELLHSTLELEASKVKPEETAPAMSGSDMALSIAVYGGTIALLTWIIFLMATVVDGTAAFEVLE